MSRARAGRRAHLGARRRPQGGEGRGGTRKFFISKQITQFTRITTHVTSVRYTRHRASFPRYHTLNMIACVTVSSEPTHGTPPHRRALYSRRAGVELGLNLSSQRTHGGQLRRDRPPSSSARQLIGIGTRRTTAGMEREVGLSTFGMSPHSAQVPRRSSSRLRLRQSPPPPPRGAPPPVPPAAPPASPCPARSPGSVSRRTWQA